ncbi:MAG: hypothetical protein J5813_03675 [Candidatus Methanomethylophilaceae archaeon]|nr:hypothetical protein [Candidatus Methanomethylophilaceae archaeon]
MKQSIVLILAVLAAAAMMVPMQGLVAEDSVYLDDASDSATTLGYAEEYIDDQPSRDSLLGASMLITMFSLFMLLIYLEHKGILKDPMLY